MKFVRRLCHGYDVGLFHFGWSGGINQNGAERDLVCACKYIFKYLNKYMISRSHGPASLYVRQGSVLERFDCSSEIVSYTYF